MPSTDDARNEQVETIISQLTLEEKATLLSGDDFWHTAPIERLGVPAIMVTDGPYGLRKQPTDGSDHLGIGGSTPATCFPPPIALGSSFDRGLIRRVGAAIGEEAKQEDVAVVLGPGVNIKRSPLCGRNFEYYSEDPIVAGDLGGAWVDGVQSVGIGTSLKHFAVNNQETGRMIVSAEVDERPLREIYLAPFERIVRDSQPWTVMCSYNRINGVYASEDPWLLTDVLRSDWGFDGLVVSDWTAVLDLARSVRAGLDLEMPSTSGFGPAAVVSAVRNGELDEQLVDAGVRRVLTLVFRAAANREPGFRYDVAAHHALAREAATRGSVLLKNEGQVLPLDPAIASIAVIGEFARTPRFQGAGSSQIVPTQVDTALEAITAAATGTVTFAPGFTLDDAPHPELLAEAVSVASDADVVLAFLGLPASYESEGFDREHIDLPTVQREALSAIVAANPNTVVVLSNGSVVEVASWIDTVPAVLETWLLGQATGSATADLLFGAANPSGRLTETIPLRLEDNPAYLTFPGENNKVRYGEGIFVGYRWYDAKKIDVAFPFGYGLSYTTFAYENLSVASTDAGLAVTFDVRNTGERSGFDVPQVYVGIGASRVARPVRELKGYASVWVEAGVSEQVTIEIPRRDLAYYDDSVHAWLVESGDYTVSVGASSRDLRLGQTISVAGDSYAPELTLDSTLEDWLKHSVGAGIVRPLIDEATATMGAAAGEEAEFMLHMLAGMRLSQLSALPMFGITRDDLDGLVQRLRDDTPRG